MRSRLGLCVLEPQPSPSLPYSLTTAEVYFPPLQLLSIGLYYVLFEIHDVESPFPMLTLALVKSQDTRRNHHMQ